MELFYNGFSTGDSKERRPFDHPEVVMKGKANIIIPWDSIVDFSSHMLRFLRFHNIEQRLTEEELKEQREIVGR